MHRKPSSGMSASLRRNTLLRLCAYAHIDKSGISACIYLKFKKHTQKIRLRSPMRRKFISGVTCAENPLVEYLRQYADILRVSTRIVRTCAHCEVWSFCVRIHETIVTCAENPVVEHMRRKSSSGVSATIRRYTPRLYKDFAYIRTSPGLEFLRTDT